VDSLKSFSAQPRGKVFIADRRLPPDVASVLVPDATMPGGVLLVISRGEANTAPLYAGIVALAIVTRGGTAPFGGQKVEVMRSGTIRGEDGSIAGSVPRGLANSSGAQERVQSLVARASRVTPMSVPLFGTGSLISFGDTK
jgi:hypothetical protein